MKININADMGEFSGADGVARDAQLLAHVASTNIACGLHAGDSETMEQVARLAVSRGVSIGAHPGFADPDNFGRREIRMNAAEVERLVAGQIETLQTLAGKAGGRVSHMKPHGALYNMAAVDDTYALAIGRALRAVDASLVYVGLAGSRMIEAAERLGLAAAREGYCDRQYEDTGQLTSRSLPGAVISDPQAAAKQAVEIACHGQATTRAGTRIPCRVDTLCIHGDEPAALAVAKAVREGLEAAGIDIVPISSVISG